MPDERCKDSVGGQSIVVAGGDSGGVSHCKEAASRSAVSASDPLKHCF